VQKAYQGLLVTALKDKRMKLQRLSEMLHGSNGTAVNPAMGVASPGTSATNRSSHTPDSEIISWLQRHNFDEFTVNRLAREEEYTKEDLLDLVSSREELIRIGLRGGVACRLWRLICQHRNDQEVRAGRIFANNSSFGGLSARTSRDDYSAATAAPAIADELYTVAEMT